MKCAKDVDVMFFSRISLIWEALSQVPSNHDNTFIFGLIQLTAQIYRIITFLCDLTGIN